MTTRQLQLPLDFSLFTEFLPRTLSYPENESWNVQPDEEETIVDAARSLKRFWPLIRLVQKVSPGLGEFLGGFVWEEEGQPAGMVNYQRLGKTDRWYITNVSVLPEFRRRGIARRLVEKTLAHIRSREGRMIILDVISENVPAFSLYEKMGFEYFSGSTQMILENPGPPGDVETAPMKIEKAGSSSGKIRFDMDTRITPPAIQAYDPIEAARYKQPAAMKLVMPLVFFFGGQKAGEYFVQTPGGQVAGRLRFQVRTRPGGQNMLNASLDPQQANLAPAVIQFLLSTVHQTSPGRTLVLDIPNWQPDLIQAAEQAGFEKRWEFRRMGLKIG